MNEMKNSFSLEKNKQSAAPRRMAEKEPAAGGNGVIVTNVVTTGSTAVARLPTIAGGRLETSARPPGAL